MWRGMRLVVAALVAVVIFGASSASAENTLRLESIELVEPGVQRDAEGYMPWATLGRAPCRQGTEDSCTLEAALRHSGLPADVQAALRHRLTKTRPEFVEVPDGVRYDWMQFRADQFLDRVVTAWRGRTESAARWVLDWPADNPTVRYVVEIFGKCGNRTLRREVPPPIAIAPGGYIDRGLRVFECPPGTPCNCW